MADIFKNRAVASEPMHTQVYRNFKGVDLSSAITEVDPARSPAAPNMIANLSGFPQKRTGTLTIGNFALGGRINGLFCFITAQNSKIMIVHAGTKIYIMQPKTQAPNSVYYPEDCTPQVLFSGANDARSISFCYDGKLYILDGKNYIVYNGTGNFEHVEANAYIPTTAIAMLPSGGGEDFEPINLLQPQRINSYKGTADATSYQLDAQSITSVIKCEKMIEGGTWQNISAYSVDLANGKVVFASAPGVSVVQGDDN
ncbi:MAG: hypothetical protein RR459_07855, partial [Christensenellaceae bacterium]